MSDIIPFLFGTYEVRVHVDDDGNPWWEAQDVCVILGLKDTSQALTRLRLGEKRTSGTRNVLIINESGLYRLIFRSNRHEAQRFQDWVFTDVLPAIRKTGRYEARPQVKNPVHQLIIDTVVRLDAVEQRALAAEQRALVAETKADLLLADRRMTLEEFILKNGLLHKFPLTQSARYTAWLKTFCLDYGLSIEKVPVVGKPWEYENSYPLAALGAWIHYEQRRPSQVSLLRPPQEEMPS